jgi:hypothetical protein
MRSDFWSLPYAARQAIRKGESEAETARQRAYTISELRKENDRLRQIISDCATALGNGAAMLPTATVDFMGCLPDEIRLHVAKLSATQPSEKQP